MNEAGEVDDAKVAEVLGVAQDGDEFKTLKYQLLGPSLTKAGQDSVDQNKVCILVRRTKHSNSARYRKSFTMLPRALNFSTEKRSATKS